MNLKLIDYLTGGLDEAERVRLEALLRDDADLRAQLDRVKKRLSPLLVARQDPVPPPGLVIATIIRVAEAACQKQADVETIRIKSTEPAMPKAPITTVRQPIFDRPWWRRADFLVAASLLLTALGLAIPAALHLRSLGLRTECANNMRSLWEGLQAYQTQHHSLPDVAASARPAAGMVVPILREAGVMPHKAVGFCPGAASAQGCSHLTLNDLASLSPKEFEKAADQLLPGYAYSLGFRDQTGRLHGPSDAATLVANDHLPVLADAPASPVAFGNSPNHSGAGQNVLYLGGHVAFKSNRASGLQGDDIYLNDANKVAAGLGPHDVVLGTSGATP